MDVCFRDNNNQFSLVTDSFPTLATSDCARESVTLEHRETGYRVRSGYRHQDDWARGQSWDI